MPLTLTEGEDEYTHFDNDSVTLPTRTLLISLNR